KRVTTFDEFVEIPGCCSGAHTSEPTEAPKPVVTAPGAQQNNRGASGAAEGAPGQVSGAHHIPPPPEAEDDLSISVPAGAKCLRRGCGATYVDEAASRRTSADGPPLCSYHPGAPVFHEGSKGYSCCPRKVLEFDEFLKLAGCKTSGNHRFLGGREEDKARENVELKIDWYQTPTSVILSVFGKKADKQLSTIAFADGEITIDLKLPEGKAYHKVVPLSQPIVAAESKYDVGTVGSKTMFLANDAPLYATPPEAQAEVRK
ncbi:MAG: diploid state maintenance protein chpA, partial [Olpidium bornovanus]